MIDTQQDNQMVSDVLDDAIEKLKEKYGDTMKESIENLESIRHEIALSDNLSDFS